jgi:HK97 family phage major capsid protein
MRANVADIVGKKWDRTVKLDAREVSQENRTVELAFSSSTPIVRWWGIEILSHDDGAIVLDRLQSGGALLLNHDSESQIGVVERCNNDKKVGRATVRFSRSELGEEIFQDVKDGIRRNCSTGYIIHQVREMTPEEMDDDLKTMALEEKLPCMLVERWEPYEISIVAVPADISVGVGRDLQSTLPDAKEGEHINQQPIRGIIMGDTQNPSPELEAKSKELDAAIKAARKAEIESISARYFARVPNVKELEARAIQEGWDGSRFKGELFDRISDQKPFETPVTALGLNEKEKKSYSLTRVLAAMAGEKVDATYELECSREIEKRIGKGTRGPGFFLPFEFQERDLTVGAATSGGNLVQTSVLANEWQDALRADSVAGMVGMRFMTLSGGQVTFPRQTGAATAYWPGEGNSITESSLTTGVVTGTAHEVATYQEVSRKLLIQATPSIESIVRNDLVRTVMLSQENKAFHGAGTYAPTGITSASGVGTVTAAGIEWENVVEFWSDVATANAAKGSLWYVTHPASAGILKTRPIQAGYPAFLMSMERNYMNGYPVAITSNVTSGYMFFGDFSKIVLLNWGQLEIIVDPYSLATTGLVRINIYGAMDACVITPAAFTYCSDLS